MYKNTDHCIFLGDREYRENISPRTDPAAGGRRAHRQPGRPAPPPRAAEAARHPSHAFARPQELKLVKTHDGYKQTAALPEEAAHLLPLTRALGEFLLDIRPAENLLVLKTPPSGAQPLAAAVDGAKFSEIAGTIAGDDTVLIITPTKKSRDSLQKKIEALVK
jgi:arginine repressor